MPREQGQEEQVLSKVGSYSVQSYGSQRNPLLLTPQCMLYTHRQEDLLAVGVGILILVEEWVGV